jgi:agmatine/peptidylarginine deiminase
MNHRFFPPEWAPQSAVLIAWPRPNGDFARWYPDVEQCYLRIAESITRHQDLIIACDDDVCRNSVCDKFQDSAIVAERVHFVSVPYDDVWVRDTAPLTVETPAGPLLLDFRFNAWGAKYACTKDAAFAYNLCRSGLFGDTERESVDFVLEGGSIETDGAGTLLTCENSLVFTASFG